jgi:hypothetical protein
MSDTERLYALLKRAKTALNYPVDWDGLRTHENCAVVLEIEKELVRLAQVPQ